MYNALKHDNFLHLKHLTFDIISLFTDRQTDRQTDIIRYRAAIAAKNNVTPFKKSCHLFAGSPQRCHLMSFLATIIALYLACRSIGTSVGGSVCSNEFKGV